MSDKIKKTTVPRLRFPEFQDAGEWISESLGNKSSNIASGKDRSYSGGVYDLYGSTGIIGRTDAYSHDGDFILVARVGANAGFLNRAIGQFGVTDNTLVISLHDSQNTHFVYFALERFGLSKLMFGSGQPLITGGQLKNLLFYWPQPAEQQKIATCLSSLDDEIAAEAEKLVVLKAHKRGLMQALFPVEGETVPKIRFAEFEKRGPWELSTIAKLSSFRRGSFPQPYGLPEWYDAINGMPFIQVFDVDENFLLKPKTKSKISKLAAEQSVFIPKGTVIITLQGSIGRVAVTQYDAYVDRTLLLFEEFFIPINKTFFAYTLFLLFEIEKQKAPGGIIKTITKEVLSDFKISIPSIGEQEKIADTLSSLDVLIAAQSQKIAALGLHKQGLMKGLFPNINPD